MATAGEEGCAWDRGILWGGIYTRQTALMAAEILLVFGGQRSFD